MADLQLVPLLYLFCLFVLNASQHHPGKSTVGKQNDSYIESFGEEKIQIGDPVGPSEFAGALILYVDGKYSGPFCGSTFISSDRVLTAAHCFSPELGSPRVQLKVVFGLSDIQERNLIANRNNPGVSIISFDYASDVFIHQGYVGEGDWFQHDIAIIKLREQVSTRSAKPIKLARNTYVKGIYDVGWGRKNCTHTSVETLRRAKAQVVSNAQCNYIWMGARDGVPVHDSQVCAFFSTANQQMAAVSAGDSGGPLFKAGPGEKIQIGVLSHVAYYDINYELGWRCTNPRYPQIFTRVSYYENWIKGLAPTAQFG